MAAPAGIPRRWTVADSVETYAVRAWGGGYFGINDAGNVAVTPGGPRIGADRLKELVDEVRAPRHRPAAADPLHRHPASTASSSSTRRSAARSPSTATRAPTGASTRSRSTRTATSSRHIAETGQPYHYGLEAGSKPELLAVMAMLDDDEALIICNGYKDEEYIETALLASKLGPHRHPRRREAVASCRSSPQVAKRTGVKPRIGMRAKLSTRGAGRWEASGGDRSKFGLSVARDDRGGRVPEGRTTCSTRFELLHFHLGSQISPSARSRTRCARRAASTSSWPRWARRCKYLDVGGGLGVDYDGSQTNFASSMNYSMQEYANDIVFAMLELCDADGVPHPTLVSESGRAVVAHHAVLVVDVLGVGEFDVGKRAGRGCPSDAPPVVRNLVEAYREVTPQELPRGLPRRARVQGRVPDAVRARPPVAGASACSPRISSGASARRSCASRASSKEVPEELEGLEKALADTYFCNFSMFQSLPDSWAIDQLFPILPIHRLQRGADAPRGARRHHLRLGRQDRPLHRPARRQARARAAPAQRTRTTTSASSSSARTRRSSATCTTCSATPTRCTCRSARAAYHIDHVVPGDTVTEVLKYVSYNTEDLVARAAPLDRRGAPRQAHDARRVAPAAALVRSGPGRLHLPRARLGAGPQDHPHQLVVLGRSSRRRRLAQG